MEFTINFLQVFTYLLYLVSPLILSLMLIIILLGQFVGARENWSWFDALYWSFITALTVGYGDIRPTGKLTKSLAVVITIIGLILSGIIVAIAFGSIKEVAFTSIESDVLMKTLDDIAK